MDEELRRVIAMAEVIDSRGNDREGKEEADEGQVDCQPGRIGQLQGASVGVGSAAKDQMAKIHGTQLTREISI